jgi:hypothetical protein
VTRERLRPAPASPGSYRVFDLVSVSFEFRFRACVLPWVEILKTRQVEFTLYFSYVLSTQ